MERLDKLQRRQDPVLASLNFIAEFVAAERMLLLVALACICLKRISKVLVGQRERERERKRERGTGSRRGSSD